MSSIAVQAPKYLTGGARGHRLGRGAGLRNDVHPASKPNGHTNFVDFAPATANIVDTASSAGTSRRCPFSITNMTRQVQASRLLPSINGWLRAIRTARTAHLSMKSG